MIWEIYEAVAVVSFTVSMVVMVYFIFSAGFAIRKENRQRAQFDKDLRSILEEEQARKHMKSVLDPEDNKED